MKSSLSCNDLMWWLDVMFYRRQKLRTQTDRRLCVCVCVCAWTPQLHWLQAEGLACFLVLGPVESWGRICWDHGCVHFSLHVGNNFITLYWHCEIFRWHLVNHSYQSTWKTRKLILLYVWNDTITVLIQHSLTWKSLLHFNRYKLIIGVLHHFNFELILKYIFCYFDQFFYFYLEFGRIVITRSHNKTKKHCTHL